MYMYIYTHTWIHADRLTNGALLRLNNCIWIMLSSKAPHRIVRRKEMRLCEKHLGVNHHESESKSHSVMSDFLWPHRLYPWNSPGQNTGVGSLSLLQGIFPTQGSNPGLPHCRQILYQLSHKGSPRTLEWVAYPFSSGSSWPRNWTGVSCIAGRFFTNWAMREACKSP